jgi:hypothetical protein
LASQINASNSGFGGIVSTGDSSGQLQLQAAGTTIAALTSTGMAVTGTLSASGVTTFAAGTAALPAITTTGDTDTGIWFPAANTVAASTSGTEAMRIDSSGNVGIGTTSPSTYGKLAIGVSAPASAVTTILGIYQSNGVDDSSLRIAGYRYTGTAQTAIDFIQNSGTSFQSKIAFSTDSGGGMSERMRIDSSGNLLVGVTSGSYNTISSGNGYAFTVAQTTTGNSVVRFDAAYSSGTINYIAFYAASTYRGAIQFNGTSVTYTTSSDYRLKENIVPMTGALDTIAQLKPVTYTWKADGSNGQGFIAHELQEHFPEAVSGKKDEFEDDGSIKPQGIDTSFLVATLTAAIQEQQTIINDLKARIETLEAK